MERRQTELDAALTRFGESLKGTPEFYKEGTKLANDVFETLKKQSKYAVDRVYFYGSFGKKTDVLIPDLDLIAVVNDCQPPVPEVLKEFKAVISNNRDLLKIQPEPIEETPIGLPFSFKNGIEVDLLVAANIKDMKLVEQKIRMSPEMAFFYSPSCGEKQIEFLKSQDSFTHTLIRLVKLWFKSLDFGKKFRGGSVLMEVISIAVVYELNSSILGQQKSMFQHFTKVIEAVMKVDTLKIAFKEAGTKWVKVADPEREWNDLPAVRGKCFVLDPACRFQDILEMKGAKRMKSVEKLKNYASTTRRRLSHLVQANVSNRDFIKKLFEPQPASLTEDENYRIPDVIVLDHKQNAGPAGFWDIKKNANRASAKDVDWTIKVLRMNLLITVNTVIKGDPKGATLEHVRDAVQDMIKTSLKMDLPSSNRRHEEMDVNLIIPYSVGGKGYAVHFSMLWK